MNSMQEICVIADDCGLSKPLDDEIYSLYKMGKITDLSVVSCGESFESFVDSILDLGSKSVGLHSCFVDGERALTGVSILTDKVGRFKGKLSIIIISLIRPKKFQKYLDLELRTQFKKLASSGLEVEHLDSHQHLHLLPAAQKVFVNFALEFNLNLRLLEITKVQARPISLVLLICLKLAEKRLKKPMWKAVRSYRALGFEYSGRMSSSVMSFYLRLSDGIPKIFITHPGKRDESMPERYLNWGYHWEGEVQTLLELKNPRVALSRIQGVK